MLNVLDANLDPSLPVGSNVMLLECRGGTVSLNFHTHYTTNTL